MTAPKAPSEEKSPTLESLQAEIWEIANRKIAGLKAAYNKPDQQKALEQLIGTINTQCFGFVNSYLPAMFKQSNAPADIISIYEKRLGELVSSSALVKYETPEPQNVEEDRIGPAVKEQINAQLSH